MTFKGHFTHLTNFVNLCKKSCRFNTSVMMTPIKRRKRQTFAYRIFMCKISSHHYHAVNF